MGHTAFLHPTIVSLFLAVGAPLTALYALGCTTHVDVSGDVEQPVPTDGSVDAEVADGGSSSDGPAIHPPPAFQGSQLCNALRWTGCYPDDPKTANAQECNLQLDGGTFGGSGVDKQQLACHVERAPGDPGVKPVCTMPGNGGDGDSCNRGTDCGPGLECVADGNGTCRPYCCSGSCSDSSEFCDIQTTTDSRLRVPVCMPIRPCSLLDRSNDGGASCASNETCAVARDNGATTCVAVGPRQVGDGCDTDHCARQLTCLGSAGYRSCFALCRTSSHTNDCAQSGQSGQSQMCSGGLPLFPVPGVGICK